MPAPDIASLTAQAELGRVAWETVAIHEKATLGYVLLDTYNRMTNEERARVGGMNQTTARLKLGLKP